MCSTLGGTFTPLLLSEVDLNYMTDCLKIISMDDATISDCSNDCRLDGIASWLEWTTQSEFSPRFFLLKVSPGCLSKCSSMFAFSGNNHDSKFALFGMQFRKNQVSICAFLDFQFRKTIGLQFLHSGIWNFGEQTCFNFCILGFVISYEDHATMTLSCHVFQYIWLRLKVQSEAKHQIRTTMQFLINSWIDRW